MQKNIIRLIIITAILLSIPLIAMQFTDEVDWNAFDFLVMGILIFGIGLAYLLITRKTENPKRKMIVGAICAVVFLYIWAELAVGIFNIPGISGS